MIEWVVRDVKPLEDYKLLLTFADKSRKVYDCKPLLSGSVFQPLKNKVFFKTVHLDGGCSVCWNDTIDIDPEILYEDGVPYED